MRILKFLVQSIKLCVKNVYTWWSCGRAEQCKVEPNPSIQVSSSGSLSLLPFLFLFHVMRQLSKDTKVIIYKKKVYIINSIPIFNVALLFCGVYLWVRSLWGLTSPCSITVCLRDLAECVDRSRNSS